MKNLLPLKEAIYEMGLFFNQQPSEDRINAYAKALANYEANQIIFAFKQVINSGTAFFPSLAEILKHLRPVVESGQDKAPQVAQEILQLLRSFGPHAEVEMVQKASDDAKLVLSAIGYTGDIRNSENYETTKAQIERLAKGVLASRSALEKNEQLKKIGITPTKVLLIKDPTMKALEFEDYKRGSA